MLCVPVVQAVTQAMFGPFRPYMIDRWPETMLMIELGTKNGDTRRGPLSCSSIEVCFDGVQTADAGADRHADARRVGLGHFQAGVVQGLGARRDAVVDERIHLLDVFRSASTPPDRNRCT